MNNNILSQFGAESRPKNYIFGKITEVNPSGLLLIETATGLQITIRDETQAYQVGDQIIIASPNGDLNNAFIIKKTDNIYPVAVNFVVENNEG